MSDGLISKLKTLRLSGLGNSLEVRLSEQVARGLTHREFLELVLQDELMVRNGRADRAPHNSSLLSGREAIGRF